MPHPQLALRYTQLAAEAGIKGAAAALSHAYATGTCEFGGGGWSRGRGEEGGEKDAAAPFRECMPRVRLSKSVLVTVNYPMWLFLLCCPNEPCVIWCPLLVCSLLENTGGGVGAGCLPGPIPAAAVTTLRSLLQASSDVCPSALFADTPDGLNLRTTSPSLTPSHTGSAAAAAAGGAGGASTPGSVSTPAAAAGGGAQQRTPRNSIARLISRRGARGGSISPGCVSSPGGLLGPDGVPVGSLFAIADKLTQAAAAAQSTARTAFDAEAEEEAKVGVVVL